MGSPSELRIICKKQFAWAHLQTHGCGRVVAIELGVLKPVLAVVASPQQEHAHRARKQRQRGVDENPHEAGRIPSCGGECRTEQDKPVPEEQDAHEQEAVELRIGGNKLARDRAAVPRVVSGFLAEVAEYHAQRNGQRHQPIQDGPKRAVRLSFAGNVIERFDHGVDCDRNRHQDEKYATNSLERIHNSLPCDVVEFPLKLRLMPMVIQ